MTTRYATMARAAALAAAPLAIIAAIAAPAQALDRGRVDCPDRAVIVEDLEKAGEQRVAVGMKPEGIVMEIFVSRAGTWTEIWTWPRGQSCVIAYGQNLAVTAPYETM